MGVGRRKHSRDLQKQASLRDVIVRHAHDWSHDADLGAGRLGSAISHLGYAVDSASSPQSRSFSEGGLSPTPNFPFSMPVRTPPPPAAAILPYHTVTKTLVNGREF